MNAQTIALRTLLVVQAAVALTALAGGAALVFGALSASSLAITPPVEYLAGSPFTSYFVPGLVLALVVGGIHAVAFVLLLRRARGSAFVSAAAAFALLIWIFVQMVFIPFSPLQAAYFIAGIAEAGLVMVVLGLFAPVDSGLRHPSLPD